MDVVGFDPSILERRQCDGCVMCCVVFPVPEAGKPDYEACPHASAGEGCAHYETRPEVCRDFFCGWRLDPTLGDEWKPSVAGFVLHDPPPWSLLVSCDVAAPDAWRREPYVSRIRAWVAELQRRQGLAGARAGDCTRLLLKDREIEIDG